MDTTSTQSINQSKPRRPSADTLLAEQISLPLSPLSEESQINGNSDRVPVETKSESVLVSTNFAEGSGWNKGRSAGREVNNSEKVLAPLHSGDKPSPIFATEEQRQEEMDSSEGMPEATTVSGEPPRLVQGVDNADSNNSVHEGRKKLDVLRDIILDDEGTFSSTSRSPSPVFPSRRTLLARTTVKPTPQSKASPNLLQFIQENSSGILERVLLHLYVDYLPKGRQERQAYISTLALVCKRWVAPVNSRLYKNPYFGSAERAARFEYALKTYPDKGLLVEKLIFGEGSSADITNWPTPFTVPNILRMSPNTECVSIGALQRTDLRAFKGAIVQSSHLEEIRACGAYLLICPEEKNRNRADWRWSLQI